MKTHYLPEVEERLNYILTTNYYYWICMHNNYNHQWYGMHWGIPPMPDAMVRPTKKCHLFTNKQMFYTLKRRRPLREAWLAKAKKGKLLCHPKVECHKLSCLVRKWFLSKRVQKEIRCIFYLFLSQNCLKTLGTQQFLGLAGPHEVCKIQIQFDTKIKEQTL